MDVDRPLPRGLYAHGRRYRARRPGGPWIDFGDAYGPAVAAFARWREDGNEQAPHGTVARLLDDFTLRECQRRVKAKLLKPRTALDYRRDAPVLKVGLGKIRVAELAPHHIATYRDVREETAPGHVRNELACLSAALQWAVEAKRLPANPARQVKRHARGKRMRLVTHDEYLAVFAKATPPVRLAMALAVRTLALPGDLLTFGPRHLVRGAGGERILRFERGKTGVTVEVLVEGEIAGLIDAHLAERVVRATFVSKVRPRHAGERYTVDGIGSMFRRYCAKAGMSDFGLRDLRAKGATDMVRAGVDLRQVQLLLGHSSVRTTEVYIKSLMPGVARPNMTVIVAAQ